MIHKSQLASWRAVCEAATPGPWRNGIGGVVQLSDAGKGYPLDYYPGCADVVTTDGADSVVATENDLEFIAAARTAMPALLDEVERLRKLVGEACDLADIADDLIDPAALPCGEDRDAASDRLAAIRKEAGCE